MEKKKGSNETSSEDQVDEGRRDAMKTIPVVIGAIALFVYGARNCVKSLDSMEPAETEGKPAELTEKTVKELKESLESVEEYLGSWELPDDDICATLAEWPANVTTLPNDKIKIHGKEAQLLSPAWFTFSPKWVCRKGRLNSGVGNSLPAGIYEIEGELFNVHILRVWFRYKKYVFFGKKEVSHVDVAIRRNGGDVEFQMVTDVRKLLKGHKFEKYASFEEWYTLKPVNPEPAPRR